MAKKFIVNENQLSLFGLVKNKKPEQKPKTAENIPFSSLENPTLQNPTTSDFLLDKETNESLNLVYRCVEATDPLIYAGQNFDLKTIKNSVEERGLKTRFKNNFAAIQIIHRFEEQKEQNIPIVISNEEKTALASYTGWGGLHQPFEENKEQWKKEYLYLKKEVKEKNIFAYEKMKESSLNSYYTTEEIINFTWKGAQKLGFSGGSLLEPSAGVGKFIGYAPDEIKDNLNITFNELDEYSYKCAYYLYPKTRDSNKDFKYFHTENKFDLILQNPPFGKETINDSNYKDLKNYSIHNYFIAKSNELLKDNGIMAVVVTHRFLDVQNPEVRKNLAKTLELVAAFRLPNTTFKSTSTEVTTDIIFFKKNPDPNPQRWVDVNIEKNDIGDVENQINNYYVQNPDNLLGHWGKEGSMYKEDEFALIEDKNEPLKEKLERALNTIPKNYKEPTVVEESDEKEEIFLIQKENHLPKIGSYFIGFDSRNPEKEIVFERVADPSIKDYSSKEEREVFDYNSDVERKNFYAKKIKIDLTQENKIKEFIKLGKNAEILISKQLDEQTSDEVVEKIREILNQKYDSFVRRFGELNKSHNKKLFYSDITSSLVFGLENIEMKDRKKIYHKAQILKERTQYPHQTPTTAESSLDALYISLEEKGGVDINYIASLTNKSIEKTKKDLENYIIKTNPVSNNYVTIDDYLSGNVKGALFLAQEYAQTDESFFRNVKLLEEVQPPNITIENIYFLPSSHWIPHKIQNEFCREIFGENLVVSKNEILSTWEVTGLPSSESQTVYSTDRRRAEEIYRSLLNNQTITVYDQVSHPSNPDSKMQVVNEKESRVANESLKNLENKYKEWVLNHPNNAKEIEKIYNETFNRYVPKKYNGDKLKLPATNQKIELREHQKQAILHILDRNESLIHHEVGAGKTNVAIAAAMESKRLKKINKPMFVVPNHMVEEWNKQFIELYPSATVLVPSKTDLIRANRRVFFSKIANNNYDAIIMPHSSFTKIPLKLERQAEFFQEEISRIQNAIEEYKKESGQNYTQKSLSRIMKVKKAQFDRLLTSIAKDQHITFEDLGIDSLIIDESQVFKNLFYTTGHTRISGLGNPEGSQRALDLFSKIQTLKKISPKSKIVFLSGTPVSNSIAEMYNLKRYLQPKALDEMGIRNFDNWLSSFAEIKMGIEITATKVKTVNRLRNFKNIPELLATYKNFAHVVLNDEIIKNAEIRNQKINIPESINTNIIIPASKKQFEAIDYLIDIADEKKETIAKRDDEGKIIRGEYFERDVNILEIITRAKKLSLDQRAYDNTLNEEKISKINVITEMINDRYKKWDNINGTQLVFLDSSVPIEYRSAESANQYSFYTELKTKLISKGIPSQEIVFIQSCKDNMQKQKLFEKMNEGKVRVLIGSTEKMGAGTNVQKRLVSMYNVDATWRPSDLTQRAGRIIRQGNLLAEHDVPVEIVRISTENTFDASMWGLLESKAKAIAQIYKQDNLEREIKDEEIITIQQMKADSTGNKDFIKELELQDEIKRLESQNKLNQRIRKEAALKIEKYKKTISADNTAPLKKDLDYYKKTYEENSKFEITLFDTVIKDRAEANLIINNLVAEIKKKSTGMATRSHETKKMGSYLGFDIYAPIETNALGSVQFDIKRESKYTTGNVVGLQNPTIHIANIVNRIEKYHDKEVASVNYAKKEIPKNEIILNKTKISFDEIENVNRELKTVQGRIAKLDFKKNRTYNTNIKMDEVYKKMIDSRKMPPSIMEDERLLPETIEIQSEWIKDTITREDIQKQRQTLFVFGDNDLRQGLEGSARTARGELNSASIRTKKLPSMEKSAFYNDAELEENKEKIKEDIKNILKISKHYKKIKIFPLGETALSLKDKAPQTLEFLKQEIGGAFFNTPELQKIEEEQEKLKSNSLLEIKEQVSRYNKKSDSLSKKAGLDEKIIKFKVKKKAIKM